MWLASAQVGIETEFPQSELDVNGDLNVTGKIRLKGTDTTPLFILPNFVS